MPPVLRKALDGWRQGKVSNAELIRISYITMLDHLPLFKAKALPAPPDAIAKFRALPDYESAAMSKETKLRLMDKHSGFIQSERTILRDNHTNKLRLIELKEWARQSKMPDSVLGQIDQALWSHSDPQEPYDDAPVDL